MSFKLAGNRSYKDVLLSNKKDKSDFPNEIFKIIIQYVGFSSALFSILWPSKNVYIQLLSVKTYASFCGRCGLLYTYWNKDYRKWLIKNNPKNCVCEYCIIIKNKYKDIILKNNHKDIIIKNKYKNNIVTCRGCKQDFKFYDSHFEICNSVNMSSPLINIFTIIGCNIGNKNIQKFKWMSEDGYFVSEDEFLAAYYDD